ncbi:penicillin acylase family protein, partial [Acinetobacter baumannii]
VFAEMARPVILKYTNESLLTADEKKYISLLKNWDLNSEVDAKGPTVFNTIWDSLEAVVYKDEFANAKNNVGWPDDPV